MLGLSLFHFISKIISCNKNKLDFCLTDISMVKSRREFYCKSKRESIWDAYVNGTSYFKNEGSALFVNKKGFIVQLKGSFLIKIRGYFLECSYENKGDFFIMDLFRFL